MGECIRDYREKSQNPSLQAAFSYAWSAMACVTANRVETRGTRSTTQLFVVARSGSGKDYGRKMAQRLLARCGAQKRCGPTSLASGEGYATQLGRCSETFFPLDEAGRYFAREGRSSGLSANQRKIFDYINEAYTSAGMSYTPAARADAKNNYTIDCPCPTLLFSATPDSFFPALSEGIITGGFFGRTAFLTIREEIDYDKMYEKPYPSDATVEEATRWIRLVHEVDEACGNKPEPIQCDYTLESYQLVKDFGKGCNKVVRTRGGVCESLWGRLGDRLASLSMLIACSRLGAPRTELGSKESPSDIEILSSDVQLAIDILKWVTFEITGMLEEQFHDNEFSQLCANLTKYIAKRDGVTSRAALRNNFRTEKTAKAIDYLESTGAIYPVKVVAKKGQRGRHRVAAPSEPKAIAGFKLTK